MKLDYVEEMKYEGIYPDKKYDVLFVVKYVTDNLKVINSNTSNIFKVEVHRNVNKTKDNEIYGVYETTSINEIKKILKDVIYHKNHLKSSILFINAFPESFKGLCLGDNFNAKRYAKLIFDSILNEENHPKIYSIEFLSKMKEEFIKEYLSDLDFWFTDYVSQISKIEKPKKKAKKSAKK